MENLEYFTVIGGGELVSFPDYQAAKQHRKALLELAHDPNTRFNIVHTVIERSVEGFYGHVYSEIKSHAEEDL